MDDIIGIHLSEDGRRVFSCVCEHRLIHHLGQECLSIDPTTRRVHWKNGPRSKSLMTDRMIEFMGNDQQFSLHFSFIAGVQCAVAFFVSATRDHDDQLTFRLWQVNLDDGSLVKWVSWMNRFSLSQQPYLQWMGEQSDQQFRLFLEGRDPRVHLLESWTIPSRSHS